MSENNKNQEIYDGDIILHKDINIRYYSTKMYINSCVICPPDYRTLKNQDEKKAKILETTVDSILNYYNNEEYIVICDFHNAIYRYLPNLNALIQFLQKHKCLFFIGKQHVSIKIDSQECLYEFLTLFGEYDEFLYLRILSKSSVNDTPIEKYLSEVPKNDERKYVDEANNYQCVVSISVEPFISIFSKQDTFEGFESILLRVAQIYGLKAALDIK